MRSRERVARITGLSRRRVARLERAGLRHLRSLAAADACQAGATGNDTATAVGPAAVLTTPTGGDGATHGRTRNPGGRANGAPDKSGATPPRRTARDYSSSTTSGSGGRDLTVLVLLLLGAAAVAVVVREVRRGNRPAA